MRWSNLTIEADEQARLPGYRDEAVIRRFDAPEALDMRFYEVRAKSALNRVPERSRMPFRWTINPYRGCSHACVYCLAGDTRILMADGSTRELAELRVGDAIYGTERRGRSRRFVRTEVLAHWSSVKPAYRITLADGTEVVASGDHRFLTGHGWRHVTGAEDGGERRPHLTIGSEMVGPGRFAEGPDETSPDYRRGYLCGLIRGERGASPTGGSARRRADRYLQAYGATAAAGGSIVPAPGDARVRDIIAWPLSPSADWCRGFLAGAFDGHASSSAGELLQITSADPFVIDWAVSSLARLGLGAAVDSVPDAEGRRVLRLRGGLVEKLRFLHTTAPANGDKHDIVGVAVKTGANLGVRSIEPLGTAMRLYDITTGTGDFIANGVVSHNCFARPTHKYLDFGPGRDFEREIVVKVNVPEVLRAELAKRSWKGEHVAMGTNTDPYQWVEGRYKLMPGIWEAFRDFANPCSVLTKSPLVLRDLPLLREIAAVTEVSANLSIPTIDEKAWRASEPHTPHPRARMEAVAELNRNGIPTGILVAPLMPGINDDPRDVERILEAATEAGAQGIAGIGLHLRGEVRQVFMEWLRSYRPDLVEHYERLYARGAYLPAAENDRLRGLVGSGARQARARFASLRGGEAVQTRAEMAARRAEGVRRRLTPTGPRLEPARPAREERPPGAAPAGRQEALF